MMSWFVKDFGSAFGSSPKFNPARGLSYYDLGNFQLP